MNFINNWRQQLALAESATSAELELPDGEYLLTLSDGLGAAATRWEYILAAVASGSATLQRAQEGSTDQDWPAGSWIYCSLTAGVLSELLAQQVTQAAQISSLASRLTLLEAMVPARLVVTVGGDTDLAGYQKNDYGALAPTQIYLPGEGIFELESATVDTPSEPYFQMLFRGEFPVERIVSVTVQGIGTLNVADGFAGNAVDGSGPVTTYSWEGGLTVDWFANIGQQRTIEFTFAA